MPRPPMSPRAVTVRSSSPRVLLVDDELEIHEAYKRCLKGAPKDSQSFGALRGQPFHLRLRDDAHDSMRFDLEHAYGGLEAIEKTRASVDSGERFALAFVDMRMPPGPGGIETIAAVWGLDPAIQIVLATAHVDFTWVDVMKGVGRTEGLHLLRKPFHHSQVRQFAGVLAKKWQLALAS